MKWFARIVALFTGTIAISTILDGEEVIQDVSSSETLSNIAIGLNNTFLSPLLQIFKAFFEHPKEFFYNIGTTIFDSIGLTPETIFSASFVYIVIGLIVGIWLLKYIVTWALELVSKLLDPA